MNKQKMKTRLLLVVSLLLIFSLTAGCAPVSDFDESLNKVAGPYFFDTVQWQLQNIFDRAPSGKAGNTEDQINKVSTYFDTAERIENLQTEIALVTSGDRHGDLATLEAKLNKLLEQNSAFVETVELIMERQIREVLSQQDINNPIDKYIKLKFGFPPVNFKLGDPPHLLIVSPRDRIESMREIPLQRIISVDDMEEIEDGVDKLGVSSLVVELGGYATYPSFVTDEGGLMFAIETAAEEWVHHYLFFKPLGFLYLLDLSGIARNYDIATMNETVASMTSKEISAIVYEKYYAGSGEGDDQSGKKPVFDFNKEMRTIRSAVDKYLALGDIELAEEYMTQKRKYLELNGYYIRKLNQAYFAFHGAYADSPTSISPIGVELKKLRSQSNSLKEFLATAASMNSRQDLAQSIK